MIIEPKVKGFICITAHPEGCAKNVADSVQYIKNQKELNIPDIKNVLVVGSSMGYGLESAIMASFGLGAKVLCVNFDKNAQRGRTATAGMYNTAACIKLAHKKNLYFKVITGDAFSNAVKEKAVNVIEKEMGKIDLLVYSIAAPSRIDPDTGEKYVSVLKPTENEYKSKGIDLATLRLNEVKINPAESEEIKSTEKVMGGEDLLLWTECLTKQNLMSEKAKIISYSYIGPELTHDIYKNGTIGMAKNNLKSTSDKIREVYNYSAFVSVNKAVVTQSSSAIPVLPLYISILFKVMKEKNIHENCIMQIYRLYEKLASGKNITDENGFIRLDDLEMRGDVQIEVAKRWNCITNDNLCDLADIDGYRTDFLQLFGFNRTDVDYSADVEVEVDFESLGIENMIN